MQAVDILVFSQIKQFVQQISHKTWIEQMAMHYTNAFQLQDYFSIVPFEYLCTCYWQSSKQATSSFLASKKILASFSPTPQTVFIFFYEMNCCLSVAIKYLSYNSLVFYVCRIYIYLINCLVPKQASVSCGVQLDIPKCLNGPGVTGSSVLNSSCICLTWIASFKIPALTSCYI